jgi:hypothetical protein
MQILRCYNEAHTVSTAVCLGLVDISIWEKRQLQIFVSDSFQKCERAVPVHLQALPLLLAGAQRHLRHAPPAPTAVARRLRGCLV